jgi:hypothetical protein
MAMTSSQALAFIRKHGVVLEAAQGPVPSLAEAIAGAPVRGSWWSHPKSHEIFAVTRTVRNRGDVLVCRLIKGKITFVHRRLWPALVRAAGRLAPNQLSRVREVHTSTGRHVTEEVPFPNWVPASVLATARTLTEEAALAAFAIWIEQDAPCAAQQKPAAARHQPVLSQCSAEPMDHAVRSQSIEEPAARSARPRRG